MAKWQTRLAQTELSKDVRVRVPLLAPQGERMISLLKLPLGTPGTVVEIKGRKNLAARLSALGLVPGIMIKVTYVAPFGDPYIVEFKGNRFVVRKNDLANIFVNV